jgi:hypothetical protein
MPDRRELKPYDVDERPVIAVGMILWAVAFVVLLVFFRDDLRRHDTEWWLWSCGIGVVLGAYGLRFVARVQRARAAAGAQEWPSGSDTSPSVTEPGS